MREQIVKAMKIAANTFGIEKNTRKAVKFVKMQKKVVKFEKN